MRKVYIIVDEYGEYSDYGCNVIEIAFSERVDAENKVKEFEELQKNDSYKSRFSIMELKVQ